MSRAKLLERIEALERLAQNNPNPNEAAAARAKAEKLRQQLPDEPKIAPKTVGGGSDWLAEKIAKKASAGKQPKSKSPSRREQVRRQSSEMKKIFEESRK